MAKRETTYHIVCHGLEESEIGLFRSFLSEIKQESFQFTMLDDNTPLAPQCQDAHMVFVALAGAARLVQLLRDEEMSVLPVIAVGEYDGDYVTQEVITLGVDDFISKKFLTPERLYQRVSLNYQSYQKSKTLQMRCHMLDHVVDHIPQMVYIKDAQGQLTFANRRLADYANLPKQALIGKDDIAAVAQKDVLSFPYAAHDPGAIEKTSVEVIAGVATQQHVFETTRTPFYDTNSQMQQLLCVATDVTELRAKETRLASYIDVLERQKQPAVSLASFGTTKRRVFLSNMHHEIRNVMHGLFGATDLLGRTALNDDQSDYISLLRRAEVMMQSLCYDMFDLMRLEAGNFHFNHTRFDVLETIKGAITLYDAQIKQRKLHIHFDPQHLCGAYLEGDGDRLGRVFMVMLDALTRFAKSGKIQLQLLQWDQEGMIKNRIDIYTDAVAIPQEKLVALLEEFLAADTSSFVKFDRTILGMIVAKAMIERMDGELGMAPRQGDTHHFWFTFTLPRDKKGAS